jgi:hypothetical protein
MKYRVIRNVPVVERYIGKQLKKNPYSHEIKYIFEDTVDEFSYKFL